MNDRPRLLLVDDHQVMLEGLRLALEIDYDVVGMLRTGSPVADECRRLAPDALLLDLSLPDRSGLEVIGDVKQAAPSVRIVILTMHADRVLADASLQAGASGFVPKNAGMDEVKIVVREVLDGKTYVSSLVPPRGPAFAGDSVAFRLSALTPRQREIVMLLGEGKSTAAIAAALHLTHWTVTFHRTRIRKALGIDTEWELMRYALLVRMSEADAGAPPVTETTLSRAVPKTPPLPPDQAT